MRALTLIQPWSFAVAHLGKPIENRTWAPPDWLLGQRIAIHAGKKVDEDAIRQLRRVGFNCPGPTGLVAGRIESTAILVGWCWPGRGVMLAEGYEDPNATSSPWWGGPCGWLLDDVHALHAPIPCRGAQGLWKVSPDIEARIREQLQGKVQDHG